MKELQRNDEAFLNLHQTLVCYANDVPLQEDGGEKNLDGSFTSSNNNTHIFHMLSDWFAAAAPAWKPAAASGRRKLKMGLRAHAPKRRRCHSDHKTRSCSEATGTQTRANIFKEGSSTVGERLRLRPAFVSLGCEQLEPRPLLLLRSCSHPPTPLSLSLGRGQQIPLEISQAVSIPGRISHARTPRP